MGNVLRKRKAPEQIPELSDPPKKKQRTRRLNGDHKVTVGINNGVHEEDRIVSDEEMDELESDNIENNPLNEDMMFRSDENHSNDAVIAYGSYNAGDINKHNNDNQSNDRSFKYGDYVEVLIPLGFCAGEWKPAYIRQVHQHDDIYDVHIVTDGSYSVGYTNTAAKGVPSYRIRAKSEEKENEVPSARTAQKSSAQSIVRYLHLSRGMSINPENYSWEVNFFAQELGSFSSEKLLPQHLLVVNDPTFCPTAFKESTIDNTPDLKLWYRYSTDPSYGRHFESPFLVRAIHKEYPEVVLHLSAAVIGNGELQKFVSLDPENRFPPELAEKKLTNEEYMDSIDQFIEEFRMKDEAFIVSWKFEKNSMTLGYDPYYGNESFDSVAPNGVMLSEEAVTRLSKVTEKILRGDPSIFIHTAAELELHGAPGLRELCANRRRIRTVDEVVPGLCKNLLDIILEFLPSGAPHLKNA